MARLDDKPLFGNVGPHSSEDRTGAEIEPITSNSYVTYVLHTAVISNIESRNLQSSTVYGLITSFIFVFYASYKMNLYFWLEFREWLNVFTIS